MRVIIEVDDEQELERLAALLQSDLFSDALKDEAVTIERPPSRAERQAILQQLFDTYRIKLPPGWKFDRDEANER